MNPIIICIGKNKIDHVDIFIIPLLFSSQSMMSLSTQPVYFTMALIALVAVIIYVYYRSKFRKIGTMEISNVGLVINVKRENWKNKMVEWKSISSISPTGRPYKLVITEAANTFGIEVDRDSLGELLKRIDAYKPEVLHGYFDKMGMWF